MSSTAHPPASVAVTAEHPVAVAGRLLVRYGLVVVIAWIGALKYTTYEAVAIQPLVAHSPLLSWIYHIFSVRTFAAVLGTTEITAALLIALRPLAPRISAHGSALAVMLFLSALSFTTPGIIAAAAGGFPVLSVLPGRRRHQSRVRPISQRQQRPGAAGLRKPHGGRGTDPDPELHNGPAVQNAPDWIRYA
jgi:reactive chlorine resistance protein C